MSDIYIGKSSYTYNEGRHDVLCLSSDDSVVEVPKSDLSVKQKALLGIDLNYDMDDFLIWFDTPVYLPELWLTQYCDAVSDILVLAGAGVGRLSF